MNDSFDDTLPIPLRDYQRQGVDELRTLMAGLSSPRRAILQMETGGGKSICALEPLRSCYQKGRRGLFIARGRKLVQQFDEHLTNYRIPHGILMAGNGVNDAPIQVASIDTIKSWVFDRKIMDLPPADLLIIDEAHGSLAQFTKKLIESYPKASVIGLTATPNPKLGTFYGGMVQISSPSKLIAAGYLTPVRVFAPYLPDLNGLGTGADGDWKKSDLSKLMDKAQLVGDAVGHWKELANGLPTITYTTTVEHALHVRDRYLKEGINAAVVEGKTPQKERDDIYEAFEQGRTLVLVNVGVLVQGVDFPFLHCVQLLCPTRSFVKYRQAIGRAKRRFDGNEVYPKKENAILLDHAGAALLHGLPDMDIEWTIDPKDSMEERVANKKKDPDAPSLITCPKCYCLFQAARTCPSCGYVCEKQRRSKGFEIKRGKLVEIMPEKAPDREAMSEAALRRNFWHMCLRVMANKDQTMGAAAGMYTRRWKTPPWQDDLPNVPEYTEEDRRENRPNPWRKLVRELYPQYLSKKRLEAWADDILRDGAA